MCAEILWKTTGNLWGFANKCSLLQFIPLSSARKCHRCSAPGSPRGNQKVIVEHFDFAYNQHSIQLSQFYFSW